MKGEQSPPPPRTFLPLDQQLQSSKATRGAVLFTPYLVTQAGCWQVGGMVQPGLYWAQARPGAHQESSCSARAVGTEVSSLPSTPSLPPPRIKGKGFNSARSPSQCHRSGVFKADSSHTALEGRGGSAWHLLSCISPHLM